MVDAFYPKQTSIHFIIQNVSPQFKTIRIFNYPLGYGQQIDLMTLAEVSEAIIKESLIAGELANKIRVGAIVIIASDIDLSTSNQQQRNFIASAAAAPTTTIVSNPTNTFKFVNKVDSNTLLANEYNDWNVLYTALSRLENEKYIICDQSFADSSLTVPAGLYDLSFVTIYGQNNTYLTELYFADGAQITNLQAIDGSLTLISNSSSSVFLINDLYPLDFFTIGQSCSIMNTSSNSFIQINGTDLFVTIKMDYNSSLGGYDYPIIEVDGSNGCEINMNGVWATINAHALTGDGDCYISLTVSDSYDKCQDCSNIYLTYPYYTDTFVYSNICDPINNVFNDWNNLYSAFGGSQVSNTKSKRTIIIDDSHGSVPYVPSGTYDLSYTTIQGYSGYTIDLNLCNGVKFKGLIGLENYVTLVSHSCCPIMTMDSCNNVQTFWLGSGCVLRSTTDHPVIDYKIDDTFLELKMDYNSKLGNGCNNPVVKVCGSASVQIQMMDQSSEIFSGALIGCGDYYIQLSTNNSFNSSQSATYYLTYIQNIDTFVYSDIDQPYINIYNDWSTLVYDLNQSTVGPKTIILDNHYNGDDLTVPAGCWILENTKIVSSPTLPESTLYFAESARIFGLKEIGIGVSLISNSCHPVLTINSCHFIDEFIMGDSTYITSNTSHSFIKYEVEDGTLGFVMGDQAELGVKSIDLCGGSQALFAVSEWNVNIEENALSGCGDYYIYLANDNAQVNSTQCASNIYLVYEYYTDTFIYSDIDFAYGNIYNDWSALICAMNASPQSVKTLILDNHYNDSYLIVPAGCWDLSYTTITSYRFNSNIALYFDNDAKIKNLVGIDGGVQLISNSASHVLIIDNCHNINSFKIGENCYIEGTSFASFIKYEVEDQSLNIFMESESSLGDGSYSAIETCSGSSTNIYVNDWHVTIANNSLSGCGEYYIYSNFIDNNNLIGTQDSTYYLIYKNYGNTFIYCDIESPCGNKFNDWNSLYSALITSESITKIIILDNHYDDSNLTIPAGTYDLQYTTIKSYNNGWIELTFENCAKIKRLESIGAGVHLKSCSEHVVFTIDSSYPISSFKMGPNSAIKSDHCEPFMRVEDSDCLFTLIMEQSSRIGNWCHPAIDVCGDACLRIYMDNFTSEITANAFKGCGEIDVYLNTNDCFVPYQPCFYGSLNTDYTYGTYTQSINNSDLDDSFSIIINHNFNQQYCTYQMYNNSNIAIFSGTAIATDNNNMQFLFGGSISDTYNVVIKK